MKIRYLITFLLLIAYQFSSACELCEKRQPKITAGFTHGVGPDSNWDWVNISIITLFTLITLYLSIKYLVKPGEKNKDHIKRSILTNTEN